MVRLVEVERKSDVLKHPSLPCLSKYHTINLTAGCPYECRYCYAQSFRSYPGLGTVKFYVNTLRRLTCELARKRKKPELVYFSTACEPFIPYRRILGQLYQVMELLLGNSVFLLVSTKSRIPEDFLQLFHRYCGQIHVQVGLTTADDWVRRALEPKAAAVQERLATLLALVELGIPSEARMDPLIPELTDTEESFVSLCAELAQRGARNAVASYLFIRRSNLRRLRISFGNWSFHEMAKRLYTDRIREYCGGGTVRIVASAYRQAKYRQFRRIAADHGITLALCGCKNPDVTDECCHPQPPRTINNTQLPLFEQSQHE